MRNGQSSSAKSVGRTPASVATDADTSNARTTRTATHARIAPNGIALATGTTSVAVSHARDTQRHGRGWMTSMQRNVRMQLSAVSLAYRLTNGRSAVASCGTKDYEWKVRANEIDYDHDSR